jgi:hypothetical protein
MSPAGTQWSVAPTEVPADEDVAVQHDVVISNCSRLGRTANPPGFSFSNLFWFGRRR